jgi:hypothetical protein
MGACWSGIRGGGGCCDPAAEEVRYKKAIIYIAMNTAANEHLEAALNTTSVEYIQCWLAAKQTRGRGRRQGAAPDEHRCIWVLGSGERCKNGCREGGYCGLHESKSALQEISNASD